MIRFKTIPFVRILLPFLAGILITVLYKINFDPICFLTGSSIALTILFFLKQKIVSKTIKNSFIIIGDVFLVLSAMQCCYNYNIRNQENFYGQYISSEIPTWMGTIADLPKETEKFYKTKVNIEQIETKSRLKNVIGQTIVYFKKPIDKLILEPGNSLWIHAAFVDLKEPLNPNEFNYKNFLTDKNIFQSCFVDSENVKFQKTQNSFSLQLLGLNIKQSIIHSFKNSGLTTDAANLCIALLTGYDDEIDSETINAFAHSGTLHVLSVSGLHTGILYAVLLFLFGVFDRNKKFKAIQVIMIILSLGFFALITGFSPPVMRAVIMLSLMVIGKFYFNYSSNNTINILAVSAFGLLLFDPLLLFDTGFLLSYLAILGIIYFAPYLTELVNTDKLYIKKIWQLASVSIAAQITTLPLTLALFHQFPLWFVLSNLVVIPLCTLVMFLAFVLLLKLPLVEGLINLCSIVITKLIHITDVPGYGYIDMIDFNMRDAVLLSLCILCFTFFVKNRSYLSITMVLLLVLYWQTVSIIEVVDKKQSSSIGIYHINKAYALDVKNKTKLQFSSNSSEKDNNYHVKPNHTTYNYPDKLDLTIDYLKGKSVSFFHYKNEKHQLLIRFLKPQFLLVSENAEVNPELLSNLSDLKLLIADGSNNYKHIRQLKELCTKFGVRFHNTREQGYLAINLN